jgi:AcrR family transcriptional regulator
LIETGVGVDDTRQRLIDSAGQIFSEKGFEATTVREVCQSASVNIAAIHYHFGDKERLYIECVKHAHCQQGLVEFEWPTGTTSEQKLTAMVTHMLTMMLASDTPAWHIELMMRELARPTAACQALVEEFISPMFLQLLAIVNEMLPEPTPLIVRQQTTFSVVAQCLLYRYHRPIGRLLVGEEQFQRLLHVEPVARQIVAFSLGGIRECARWWADLAASEVVS